MQIRYEDLTSAQKQTCPLCGRPNGCVPSRCGAAEDPCWCTTAAFNPESLARVPEHLRNVVCLCRDCAAAPPDPPAP
jgi:hypothetical protein